jgi:TolB-like protein
VTSNAYSGSLPEPLVVSVLNFEDRIHLPEFTWVRKGLADMLITDLRQGIGVEMVQRERLEDVMREQSLQAAGRIEERTAVRVGRLTGATVMLLGSATRVGDILRLDAHFLDVERGTVLGAASVAGPLDDVLGLEKQLASRLLVLLQRAPGPIRALPSSHPPGTKAVEALYQGVDAADRGDVDGALTKFEAAMEKGRPYADAERRYQSTLRKVDAARLWSSATALKGGEEDQRRLGARIADDLFREGLLAEVQAEEDRGILHLLIRFNDVTVQRIRQEAERLGGSATELAGTLLLHLGQNHVHSEFVRAIETRRRVFLHMHAPDGSQVAIYSQLKGWAGQEWISKAQSGEVILSLTKQLAVAIRLPVLPFDQGSLRFGISLDPVPREQAALQVDLIRTDNDGRETVSGIAYEPAELEAQALRMALAGEFERLWNPDLWERAPGQGYLPSARRSIMVSAQIHKRKLTLPRLIGASGDRSFDEACLNAVQGVDSVRMEPLLAKFEPVEGALRMRVSCDLLKDAPSLLDFP